MWWQRLETSMCLRISRSFRLPPDSLSPNSPHCVFGSRFNSPLRVVFFAPLGAPTHTESDSPPWRCRSLGHNDPSDTVRFVVISPTASRRGRAWRSLGYRPVRHASQPASAVPLLGHNDPSDTVRFVVTFPTASRRGALRGHGVLSDTVLSDTVQFAMPRSPPRRCRFSVSSISRIPSSSSLPQQPRAAFL